MCTIDNSVQSCVIKHSLYNSWRLTPLWSSCWGIRVLYQSNVGELIMEHLLEWKGLLLEYSLLCQCCGCIYNRKHSMFILDRPNQALQKRSQIWDLVPNGTKVPKWSQKGPDFASKSQISDSTFRWCWKGEAHSSQSLLCSIWTYTMYHVHVFDTLWPSGIYWPLDIFWIGKCRDYAVFCMFF